MRQGITGSGLAHPSRWLLPEYQSPRTNVPHKQQQTETSPAESATGKPTKAIEQVLAALEVPDQGHQEERM